MRKLLLVACSIICFLSLSAFAQQSATATLTGRVVDPNGAVIVGVQVTATNTATDLKRETRTTDQGVFVLTDLPPGEYEIKAEAVGFKTRRLAARLEVGKIATIDLALDIGTIAASEDLFAPDLDLVNRVSSVVDGVINHRAIEHLPLNGRNYLELALLIPGNSPAPNFDPTKPTQSLSLLPGSLAAEGT